MSFNEIVDWTFLGNTVWSWGVALVMAVVVFAVLRIAKGVLLRYAGAFAAKTETQIDDMVVETFKHTKPFFLVVVSLYMGTRILTFPENIGSLIRGLMVVVLFSQVALWGNATLTFWLGHYGRKKAAGDPSMLTTLGALGFFGRVVVWGTVLLVALDNLGIDITALVAGLGVGGIAVALAVQNILGDLFASLSIVFDKPFVIGDFIIVDDILGTVKHIGLKTTRIQSLSGEEIVMANSSLLGSRIRNYKRMYERRVVFTLGVTYQTPHEKLEKIPRIIQEIIESQHLTRFDRSHFSLYGDFSLNFETVYFVKDPGYNKYMDTHQAINLAIYKKFSEEGIEFAYPTQTLFIERSSSS